MPDHRHEPAGPGARSEILPVRLPNPVLIALRSLTSGPAHLESAGPRTGCSPREGVYTSVVPAVPFRYGIPLVLAASALIAAQTGPGNNYVDARICAGCHSEIARNYLQTGMGRSLFRPAPANTLEDYTRNNEFYHPLSDTHYSMVRPRRRVTTSAAGKSVLAAKKPTSRNPGSTTFLVRATTPAPISIARHAEHSSSCRSAGIRRRAATGQ